MFIGTVEVDERWINEWVTFGLAELVAYLANQAEFAEFYERRP